MKNRWAKLGIVLLAISVLVVGCGGVSIKVLEKKNVLGTEIVNAYVSGFTNTDSTWQKLKSFGDNFDKNMAEMQINFYNDKDKVVSLDSLSMLGVSNQTEGVVATYVRFQGEGKLYKNPIYETAKTEEPVNNTEEEETAPEEPKETVFNVNKTIKGHFGEEITITTVTVKDAASGPDDWELTGEFIFNNTTSKELNPPKFSFVDLRFDNHFRNMSISVENDSKKILPQTKVKGQFHMDRLFKDRPLNMFVLRLEKQYVDYEGNWSIDIPIFSDKIITDTPIYTVTKNPFKFDFYAVKTLPQDEKNQLSDPDKEYLMVDVQLTLTATLVCEPCSNNSWFPHSPQTDWFTLLDKDSFVVPQVNHIPQLVNDAVKSRYWTTGDTGDWNRLQIFWAIPKGANLSDYRLRYTDQNMEYSTEFKLSDIVH